MAKTKNEIQRAYAKRSGYAAQKKYTSANTTRISLVLNNNTDADILEKLNTVTSKQGYIKECIRKAISAER